MSTKNIKGVIIPRHDTAENWANATNFVPRKGELIIYDADTKTYDKTVTIGDKSHPVKSSDKVRFKFGDGELNPDTGKIEGTNVNALPFASADLDEYATEEWVRNYVQQNGGGSGTTEIPENVETKDNKVTSIDEDSTDEQYPSAKAVYNAVHGSLKIVECEEALPISSEADLNTIYLLSRSTNPVEPLAYDEYIFRKYFTEYQTDDNAYIYATEEMMSETYPDFLRNGIICMTDVKLSDPPDYLYSGGPYLRILTGNEVGLGPQQFTVYCSGTILGCSLYWLNYDSGFTDYKITINNDGEWEPVTADEYAYTDKFNCRYKIKCKVTLYAEQVRPELIGSNVGFAETDGGEIFNDYLSNRALSVNSSVRGTNNIGGIKAFNVKDFNAKTKTFTLDKVFGIEVGDVFSVLTNYHSALNIGKVTAIDTTNRKVTVDTIVDKSVGVSGTIEHFFIYTKPFIGTTAVRDGCTVEGTGNIAIGDYSHVEGRGNTTLDSHSHAEGRDTKAIGNAAHSEGNITEAIGHRAHAEGRETKAIGDDSHAEGNTTEAGFIAHAEGLQTKAYGSHSHTEGAYTSTARGDAGSCAHAEGHSTQANGVAAHAEGKRTIATGEGAHAEGTLSIVYPTANYPASNILQFTYNSLVPELFMPRDNAVDSDLWALVHNRYSISSSSPTVSLIAPLHLTIEDSIVTCNIINRYTETGPLGEGIAFSIVDVTGDINLIEGEQYTVTKITERGEAVGKYSHSQNEAYAKGDYSHAQNKGISVASYSHAEGNSIAEGLYAHAEGSSNAKGESSHSEGKGIANSIYSHAEGQGTATGQSSHAEGRATASNTCAHAEGTGTASGEGAHAEGQGKALSYYSHAEGGATVSKLEEGDKYQNGNFAHAESGGKAYGTRSHAENRGIAYYLDSHAENEGKAYGQGSHAEGTGTANHTFSHAANRGTITGRSAQTVVGAYNKEVANAYFVVGDGTSSSDSGRRNAFVVKDNGSATLRTQGFDDDSVVRYELVKNIPQQISNISSSLANYCTESDLKLFLEEYIVVGDAEDPNSISLPDECRIYLKLL